VAKHYGSFLLARTIKTTAMNLQPENAR